MPRMPESGEAQASPRAGSLIRLARRGSSCVSFRRAGNWAGDAGLVAVSPGDVMLIVESEKMVGGLRVTRALVGGDLLDIPSGFLTGIPGSYETLSRARDRKG